MHATLPCGYALSDLLAVGPKKKKNNNESVQIKTQPFRPTQLFTLLQHDDMFRSNTEPSSGFQIKGFQKRQTRIPNKHFLKKCGKLVNMFHCCVSW